MLWTFAASFIALWLLGMITSNVMGGLIHIFLVIAAVIILLKLIQGRRKRLKHLALPKNQRSFRRFTESKTMFL